VPQQQRPHEQEEDDTLPGVAELQSLAAWLASGEWRQQVAAARPQLQAQVRARLHALCVLLAGTYQQACAAWRYVAAAWPAWRASLVDDGEVLLEYALGLLPAWLAVARASIVRVCHEAAASEPAQQLAALGATAAHAARRETQALQNALRQWVGEAGLIRCAALTPAAGAMSRA
jgi:hypothetical protein